MEDKIIQKVAYIVTGIGVGSLISILFAPKSGEDTREYLTDKAKEATGYAQRQAREIRGRAGDLVQHAKEAVSQKKEQIVTAMNVGRDVYHQEQLVARSGRRNALGSRPGF
jgi:gas vesicle protein